LAAVSSSFGEDPCPQGGIADHGSPEREELDGLRCLFTYCSGEILQLREIDQKEEVTHVLRVLEMRSVNHLVLFERAFPLEPHIDYIRKLQAGEMAAALMSLEHPSDSLIRRYLALVPRILCINRRLEIDPNAL